MSRRRNVGFAYVHCTNDVDPFDLLLANMCLQYSVLAVRMHVALVNAASLRACDRMCHPYVSAICCHSPTPGLRARGCSAPWSCVVHLMATQCPCSLLGKPAGTPRPDQNVALTSAPTAVSIHHRHYAAGRCMHVAAEKYTEECT